MDSKIQCLGSNGNYSIEWALVCDIGPFIKLDAFIFHLGLSSHFSVGCSMSYFLKSFFIESHRKKSILIKAIPKYNMNRSLILAKGQIMKK